MLPKIRNEWPDLAKQALQFYFPVIKKIVGLILLIALLKNLFFYFFAVSYGIIFAIETIIIVALIIFVWAISFYESYGVITGDTLNFKNALQQALRNIWNVYLAIISLVAVIFILFGLAQLFQPVSLILILFMALPLLFAMLYFYFTIPIILLEKKIFYQAFLKSASYVSARTWGRVLVMYGLTVFIVLILSPNTRHGQYLAKWHLQIPFDILVLGLSIPLINNLIIFIWNDLNIYLQR